MTKRIIIGSRGSKLALLYAEKVIDEIIKKAHIDNNQISLKTITTQGDRIKDKRLAEIGGKALFSSEIEKELKEKKIDVAIHALKDMPADETKGLKTKFFLKRNDPREILVTKNKKKLKDLEFNSTIGTSSFRREFQIKKIRPDIKCKLIRGNVDTRIKKLKDGKYDAIILSYAGMKYLNLEDEISEIFSINEIIPSAGQGIIAIQCRENDYEMISILEKINHEETFKRAHVERNVLKVLEGDCETAVGVHSKINGDEITVEAELFSIDGSQRFCEKKTKKIKEFMQLGEEVGKILKAKSKNSYKR